MDLGFLNDVSPEIIHLNESAQKNTLVASRRRAIRASLNAMNGCLIFSKVSKSVAIWLYGIFGQLSMKLLYIPVLVRFEKRDAFLCIYVP